MEPVTVTGRVRRTVRMAVALVIGQALLCALIGWLTFSQSRSAGSDQGPSAVDQLAVPPVTMRPSATTRPATTPPSPPAPSRATVAPSSRAAPARTIPPTRGTVPPAPPAPPARTTAPPRPAPSESLEPILFPPRPPSPAWPVPAPTGFLQQPVTVGEQCWPEGAFGLTRGHTLVRCAGERHRRPRWKIV